MNARTALAWLAIIILSLLPVAALIFFGPLAGNLSAIEDYTHFFGQVTGLIGMTLFALSFVLSMRLGFVEEAFGGLDKVYRAHAIMGGLALVLILSHPLLLVLKFFPANSVLAASYLLPGKYISINLGIIALLGLLLLIFITFFISLKYNMWKLSHKLLGIFFILAVLHIFLVRGSASRDYIFTGYNAYVIITAVIGVGAFLYSLFIKGSAKRASYIVESVKARNEIYDITLAPVDRQLRYKAGQFVFVKFKNKKIGGEYHPFSIASRSGRPEIRIIIKKLGDYTARLNQLKKGDKAVVEGPYGRFHYNKPKVDQVWIAAGIGITPFIGLAEDFGVGKPDYKVSLYYTVKNADEFINLEEFKMIEEKNKDFRLFTRISSTQGRLGLSDIKSGSGKLAEKEFFLCGPEEFKEAMTSGLISEGVSKNSIFSEEFNFK
jgi:predicted ferric reductase